jgi:hypothetical protein
MLFSDLALSRRLERAEGHACMRFAAARRQLFPELGAAWIECGGGLAVFDGVDSPVTQSFGLGIFEELTDEVLDAVERFFERGTAADLEVSPFAGVAALGRLCRRNYQPVEVSSVLYRAVEQPGPNPAGNIQVRIAGPEESGLWSEVNARAWSHDHPELLEFLRRAGAISIAREHNVAFLAEVQGEVGAAASLCLHEGVALFGGAATVPELRRLGLQRALMQERMRYAFSRNCDVAMMVAEPGSDSSETPSAKASGSPTRGPNGAAFFRASRSSAAIRPIPPGNKARVPNSAAVRSPARIAVVRIARCLPAAPAGLPPRSSPARATPNAAR